MTYPPGTVLEVDLYDEDADDDTPVATEWIVRLRADDIRRTNEDIADGHLIGTAGWYSLTTLEPYDDEDIDLEAARIIAVPVAETAARMLMNSRLLETPDTLTAAVWSNLTRGPEFRAAIVEAGRLVGELRGHDVSKAPQPVYDALLAATAALEFLRDVEVPT